MSVMTPRRQSRGLISLLWALLLGAPRNSVSRQVSTWAPLFSAQRWAYRFPLAYALWHECCSLPQRILSLHERGMLDNGLALEQLSREDHAQDDAYQSRSQDIQNLRKDRPWATLFDVATYVEGHLAGARCGVREDTPKFLQSTSVSSNRRNIMGV